MKKILIITYYWPPAGGPGVQRWLKFVKYLPHFNYQPVVYIPKNPQYPLIDNDLVNDVSPLAIIIKQPIIEPYLWATFLSKSKTKKISSGILPNEKKQTFLDKLFLWIRGNVFIPDARILWVKPSIKFLEKYIKENNIETIITSGPPHSLHLIGYGIKQKIKVNWIADFRDPWTTIGYHKLLKLSQFASQKHIKLERQILQHADTILVTSVTTKKEFQALTHKPIEVITNGFDSEKVNTLVLDSKFSLAHIGSFLSERNPKILWECLSELIQEQSGFGNHLEIKLIGAVSQEVIDTIADFGLAPFTNNLGYLSHLEAIEHQRKSQILLLIEIDSKITKGIIPGKLFEYMVSQRPIIAIGPKDSDFATIIKETNTGIFFQYSEKNELKSVILSYYNQFLDGNLKSNAVGLDRFSRKNLTQQLAHIINQNSKT